MRALLKPIIQPELGLVFLKPGKALLPMFGGRVLVSTEPHEFSQLPSGALPAADQVIANDPRFQPFYQQDRVIRAAGGINALEYWVSQISVCQADGEHSRHMVTLRYGNSALCLCQSHDNLYTGQTLPKLDVIADTNRAAWIVDRVRGHFLLPEGHQLTLPELCWWAVLHDLADLLPEDVSAASLRVKPYTVAAGTKREADITHTPAAQEIVAAKASKAIKVLKVDPEPPQSFMKIPKRHRWVNRSIYSGLSRSHASAVGLGLTIRTILSDMGRVVWEPRLMTFSLFLYAVSIMMIYTVTCHGGKQSTEVRWFCGTSFLICPLRWAQFLNVE